MVCFVTHYYLSNEVFYFQNSTLAPVKYNVSQKTCHFLVTIISSNVNTDFLNSFTAGTASGVTTVGDTSATEGVTPPFYSWQTWRPFFSRLFCGLTPVFSPEKLTTFFSNNCHFLLISLGCHLPGGCHPAPFLPVRPRFSTILCKFAHHFFPSVSPLEGVIHSARRSGPLAISHLLLIFLFVLTPGPIYYQGYKNNNNNWI